LFWWGGCGKNVILNEILKPGVEVVGRSQGGGRGGGVVYCPIVVQ